MLDNQPAKESQATAFVFYPKAPLYIDRSRHTTATYKFECAIAIVFITWFARVSATTIQRRSSRTIYNSANSRNNQTRNQFGVRCIRGSNSFGEPVAYSASFGAKPSRAGVVRVGVLCCVAIL